MVDRIAVRVSCLECGRRFRTAQLIPECPGCGGSDMDVAPLVQVVTEPDDGRVRFNHGFHDAVWEYGRGKLRQRVRSGEQNLQQVSATFDGDYYEGHHWGEIYASMGWSTVSSEGAWTDHQARAAAAVEA